MLDKIIIYSHLGQIQAHGIVPIIEYLRILQLPSYPSFLNFGPFRQTTKNISTFDWFDSVVSIKKLLDLDVLIGFDIFSTDLTSSVARMGIPTTTALTM